MKKILMIPVILLFSCDRLSNAVDPDLMNAASMAAPAVQEDGAPGIEEEQPVASADALSSEKSETAMEIPKAEPEESAEARACRRFLTPQAGLAASSDLKRSKLGRFHVAVAWSENLIAGELTNHAALQFFDAHQEPIPLTLMSFKLFMPRMNHGTIKLDKLIFTQDMENRHAWQVDQIYFSMGGNTGEWVVDIEAGLCGESDTIRVAIEQAVVEPE